MPHKRKGDPFGDPVKPNSSPEFEGTPVFGSQAKSPSGQDCGKVKAAFCCDKDGIEKLTLVGYSREYCIPCKGTYLEFIEFKELMKVLQIQPRKRVTICHPYRQHLTRLANSIAVTMQPW